MMKKSLLAFLIGAMLLSSVSCGSSNEETETTEPSANQTPAIEETELVETEPENPYEGINLDGYKLRVLNAEGVVWGTPQLDFESVTGDAVSDAIFERNRFVEEAIIFELEVIQSPDPAGAFTNTVQAGEDAYDAVYTANDQSSSFVTKKMCMNILDVPGIDLEQPWWDTAFNKSMILKNNYLFQASSSFNVSAFIRSVAVVFNKNMMIDHNLEIPYDMVREGKWTYDRMQEYIETCKNLNGDAEYTENGNAIYGVSTFSGWLSVAATGAGSLVQLDEEGMPFFAGADETLVNAFDKLTETFSGAGSTLDNINTYINFFSQNRALFMVSAIGNVSSLREMDAEYGILPSPKFTEEENYGAPLGSAYILNIPITNTHTQETGTALDCLSRQSYETVLPVFFDSLCYKGLRDEDSIDMLNIINKNRTADLRRFFGWTLSFLDSTGAKIVTGSLNIASEIEKITKSTDKIIAKTMDSVFSD